jgi:hypothetical protein
MPTQRGETNNAKQSGASLVGFMATATSMCTKWAAVTLEVTNV